MEIKIGESEKILSEIFQQAKDNAPAVIFFDEIDALFGHRESDESASSACQMVKIYFYVHYSVADWQNCCIKTDDFAIIVGIRFDRT